MATSTIYPFAPTDTGTNLLTTAEYEADPQRLIGHQPGVARSKLENKALRQSSVMAAALAQFIADNAGEDVSDEQTPADIAAAIKKASTDAIVETVIGGGNANWAKVGSLIFQWGYLNTVNANSVKAVTFPIAFTKTPTTFQLTLNMNDTGFVTSGAVQATQRSTSNFWITNSYNTGKAVFWFVIGE